MIISYEKLVKLWKVLPLYFLLGENKFLKNCSPLIGGGYISGPAFAWGTSNFSVTFLFLWFCGLLLRSVPNHKSSLVSKIQIKSALMVWIYEKCADKNDICFWYSISFLLYVKTIQKSWILIDWQTDSSILYSMHMPRLKNWLHKSNWLPKIVELKMNWRPH